MNQNKKQQKSGMEKVKRWSKPATLLLFNVIGRDGHLQPKERKINKDIVEEVGEDGAEAMKRFKNSVEKNQKKLEVKIESETCYLDL